MASRIAAPSRAPPAQRRRAAPAEPTEARRSQRARGVSAPGFVDDAYDDDYSGDDAREEGAPRRAWRAGGRRAYIPQASPAPERCAAHGSGALPDPHARRAPTPGTASASSCCRRC